MKNQQGKHIRQNVMLTILIVILLSCIVIIGRYYSKLKQAEKAYEKLVENAVAETEESLSWTEPTEEIADASDKHETEAEEATEEKITLENINFNILKEQNSDIYAWINIPGTQVDYPVLQNAESTDIYNDYYLNHTVDRVSGYPGSIYSEACNSKDFLDSNTVLYGHNMKNGSMFGCLHQFEEEEFFDSNNTVIVYTQDEVRTYEIYAAVKYSNTHIMKSFDFSTITGVQKYIDSINKAEGNFRADMELSTDDSILTLSTCIKGQPDNRFLVVAALKEAMPL